MASLQRCELLVDITLSIEQIHQIVLFEHRDTYQAIAAW